MAVPDSALPSRSSLTACILSVVYEKEKVGGACYDEATRTVHYLADTVDDDEFNTLRYLIDRVKPTQVISSFATNKTFRRTLQSYLNCYIEETIAPQSECETLEETRTRDPEDQEEGEDNDGDGGSVQNNGKPALVRPHTSTDAQEDQSAESEENDNDDDWSCPLQFLPKKYFTCNSGVAWLSKILDCDGRDQNIKAKLSFDLSDNVMTGALGGLLHHINQIKVGIEFEDPTTLVPIHTFKSISLGDVLYVDQVTKKALAIFPTDKPIKCGNKKKMGRKKQFVSVFDLINFTKSVPGKKKLRFWLARPLRNYDILKKRHEAIMFFSQDVNNQLTNYIRSKLRNVHGLTTVFSKLASGKMSVREWAFLGQTIGALVEIGDSLRLAEVNFSILGLGHKAMGKDLARTSELLKKTLSLNESIEEGRFVVNAGVVPELDHLKASYAQLSDRLTQTAQTEIRNYSIPSCSVCYLPIIGYMVMVPLNVAEIIVNDELEKVYSTDEYIGFKTPGMHELDRIYGDIRSRIIDKETFISNGVQDVITKRRKVIYDALEVAATLDSLISLAVAAAQHNWIRPRFSDQGVINIEDARQPITEKVQPCFVPNDIKSGPHEVGSMDKVKLIAGPNASGKSVYLKMVGVVVYLAHIGSFVPAQRAEIGPISQIMTRMYTVDSVLDGLSSFASDLRQMSNAIVKADKNSMIIIDEFGKGTMTEVGIGLLAGCVNYWLQKQSNCPHIFLATHFCTLRNFLTQSPLLGDYKMEVLQDGDGELKFTYNIVSGRLEKSYATVTASRAGISDEIINRADEVFESLKGGKFLTDIKGKNEEEEIHYNEIVTSMDNMANTFFDWDMKTDPKGFMDLVEETFRKEEEST